MFGEEKKRDNVMEGMEESWTQEPWLHTCDLSSGVFGTLDKCLLNIESKARIKGIATGSDKVVLSMQYQRYT